MTTSLTIHNLPIERRCEICNRRIYIPKEAEYGIYKCDCGQLSFEYKSGKSISGIVVRGLIEGNSIDNLLHINCRGPNSRNRYYEGDADNTLHIELQYQRNDQHSRLESAIKRIALAFKLGYRPRQKKEKDKYPIRSMTVLHFNMADKTMKFEDWGGDVTIKYTDQGFQFVSITEAGNSCRNSLTQEWIGLCEEYFGRGLAAPQDLGDVIDESWRGVMITDLKIRFELSKFHWNGYGTRDDYPSCNRERWHIMFQNAHGHIHDKDADDSRIYNYFNHMRYTDKNYKIYEQCLLNFPSIIDSLIAADTRISSTHNSEARHEYERMRTDMVENVIRANGRDKCIQCGNKIHNISAYAPFPTSNVVGDEQNRFGALCCHCNTKMREQHRQREAEEEDDEEEEDDD